ncbi:putative membrane protein SirB2 [Idiomarina fontislapidosi]|uniref:Invasion protein n=1 Tax=Idiomarina fontislapidosi TaxID=263723 RepID=A0A432YBB0_9GAMM|nr:SirB2 family protein [Idiomarina fontislapidosi]PYE35372.1 putative membrane protein SirB2 [Idiomarina fontislapidosi]RUO58259.1 invasion protein [Idiomarina fontislapidosi]
MYIAFKHLHVLFVVLSVALFMLRFFWAVKSPQQLQKKWVKIVPHVNDTFLLLSAIAMIIIVGGAPVGGEWLSNKVIGLVGYIIFGFIAFKSSSAGLRWVGFIGAVTWLLFLFHVAYSKMPILFA